MTIVPASTLGVAVSRRLAQAKDACYDAIPIVYIAIAPTVDAVCAFLILHRSEILAQKDVVCNARFISSWDDVATTLQGCKQNTPTRYPAIACLMLIGFGSKILERDCDECLGALFQDTDAEVWIMDDRRPIDPALCDSPRFQVFVSDKEMQYWDDGQEDRQGDYLAPPVSITMLQGLVPTPEMLFLGTVGVAAKSILSDAPYTADTIRSALSIGATPLEAVTCRFDQMSIRTGYPIPLLHSATLNDAVSICSSIFYESPGLPVEERRKMVRRCVCLSEDESRTPWRDKLISKEKRIQVNDRLCQYFNRPPIDKVLWESGHEFKADNIDMAHILIALLGRIELREGERDTRGVRAERYLEACHQATEFVDSFFASWPENRGQGPHGSPSPARPAFELWEYMLMQVQGNVFLKQKFPLHSPIRVHMNTLAPHARQSETLRALCSLCSNTYAHGQSELLRPVLLSIKWFDEAGLGALLGYFPAPDETARDPWHGLMLRACKDRVQYRIDDVEPSMLWVPSSELIEAEKRLCELFKERYRA